jgi:Mrp family chromosome partitioning ATPase
VLLVASPAAGEGKSLVAINLAVALSQHGKTCLIDCDLRRPVINSVFGYFPSSGWTDLLSAAMEADESQIRVSWSDLLSASVEAEEAAIRVNDFENLYVLPIGSQPDNAGEWIGSDQMKQLVVCLRSHFAFVILDSPPMIPFSDARVLSSFADGVVLVGRCGLTTRRSLTRCVERLQEIGAPTVGVVLNGMDFSSPDYHYYNFGHSSLKFEDYYPLKQSVQVASASLSDQTKAKGAGA